jgi:hypothetical protein
VLNPLKSEPVEENTRGRGKEVGQCIKKLSKSKNLKQSGLNKFFASFCFPFIMIVGLLDC